jgi:hypothetical protein
MFANRRFHAVHRVPGKKLASAVFADEQPPAGMGQGRIMIKAFQES